MSEVRIFPAFTKKPKLIVDFFHPDDGIIICGSGNFRWVKNLDKVLAGMISHQSIHLVLASLEDSEAERFEEFYSLDNLFQEDLSIRKWERYQHGLYSCE